MQPTGISVVSGKDKGFMFVYPVSGRYHHVTLRRLVFFQYTVCSRRTVRHSFSQLAKVESKHSVIKIGIICQRTCYANKAGENSSFIFTVCVKSVPCYHFKLVYVVLQMAVKEFLENRF